ncbi:AraC family transcriptional regulator [Microbulbifer sp. A4B17]|uniref:GlxA family transcriptional regulator n=1 Tax=Microbulbifer sp. A4B17 TaxID=359370 RepID=UPI000D52D609|nr:helix-turn-helix domain-containing protein [Microbulbifer sp. A4B17]AWF81298.1 AraC family transcriptional regulator [Microbulbifer sp. A4B17]
MIVATVLAFDLALTSSISGINDLLYFASKLNAQSAGDTDFRIQIASPGGKPVRTLNNLVFPVHCAIEEVEHSDVYLVPTITGNVEQVLDKNPLVVETLRHAGATNSLIGGNSSGVFFLAEAGLLDHKSATTHWTMVDLFRHLYPLVDLKPDQPITQDGNILCDCGGQAWFDLGLYLVELFFGHDIAMNLAKFFVIDIGRSTQLTYSPLISKKYHKDKGIMAIQNWLEEHYCSTIMIDQIGEQFGFSNRTMLRRFKQATGATPSQYLQEIRLDAATKLLVQSNKSIQEITHAIGYEDISSFTRLFKRKSGLSPSHYRARFKPI